MSVSKQLKLALNIDKVHLKPPLELAPGWDTAEIPIWELMVPFESDEVWHKMKADIESWNQPPLLSASHWIMEQRPCGNNKTDWDELEHLAEVSCRRMADIGCEVAGVWGNFFEIGAGGINKAKDEALKYCEMISKYADKYGVLIALEPAAGSNTVFPSYKDGIEFVKELSKDSVRLMADLNYFLRLDQPFEDIALEPDLCLHVHVQGEKYQPNVGNCEEKILHIFRVLRDIGYERSVSSAHPWISTEEGKEFNYRTESAKTLKFLQDLRAQVYAE
ncbi:MAG: sugar phosphate isomerase/epimerase [Cyclobacteriaceae bacterium]